MVEKREREETGELYIMNFKSRCIGIYCNHGARPRSDNVSKRASGRVGLLGDPPLI